MTYDFWCLNMVHLTPPHNLSHPVGYPWLELLPNSRVQSPDTSSSRRLHPHRRIISWCRCMHRYTYGPACAPANTTRFNTPDTPTSARPVRMPGQLEWPVIGAPRVNDSCSSRPPSACIVQRQRPSPLCSPKLRICRQGPRLMSVGTTNPQVVCPVTLSVHTCHNTLSSDHIQGKTCGKRPEPANHPRRTTTTHSHKASHL